jgi:hypothetical protein
LREWIKVVNRLVPAPSCGGGEQGGTQFGEEQAVNAIAKRQNALDAAQERADEPFVQQVVQGDEQRKKKARQLDAQSLRHISGFIGQRLL